MMYRDRTGPDPWAGGSWVNVLAGLWLIATPWIYGVFDARAPRVWNSIVVGVIIAVVAGIRLRSRDETPGLAWVNAILGAWMIASPWIYGYSADGGLTANSIIVGIIVLFLAITSGPEYAAGSYRGSPYGAYWGWPPYYMWPSGRRPYGDRTYGYPPAAWSGRMPEPAASFRGRGPRGFQITDDRIKDAICERMWDSPELDASDIDIAVRDGEVTLEGTVADRHAKQVAEDLADSVIGVHDVHNELRTAKAPATRDTPRRAA